MMRSSMLILSSLGCHDLRGDWEGSCVGDVGNIGVTLSVVSDVDGELDGEAVASFPVGGTEIGADLVLEGTRDGRTFSMELDSAGWALSLDGEHQNGVLEGECLLAITILDSTVLDEGEFSMVFVE